MSITDLYFFLFLKRVLTSKSSLSVKSIYVRSTLDLKKVCPYCNKCLDVLQPLINTVTNIVEARLKFSEDEMMSIGRGRGRGRGWAQCDKDPLSKPGKLCSEDIDYASLIDIIDHITLENLVEQTKKFAQLCTEEHYEEINDKLYEHAMNNREFGMKIILLYYKNVMFKSSLWKLLIRRIELREETTTMQFCNIVSLFSRFVYVLSFGNLFRKLQLALLDYMEMLLETASPEEIETFTEQIIVHGKHIYRNCKEKMDRLMVISRQILIEKDLPLVSRQMLLYAIDLVNYNVEPLPKNLQEFYELRLDKNFIQNSIPVLYHENVQKNRFLRRGSLREIRGSDAKDIDRNKLFNMRYGLK
ncbi:uncharacterized protein LOC143344872 isoform X2 [Colletes latitarsis]|uniref:uncharacterized protein LOC143344872 isoform X2 n=1 Tax=Colletes latitarsis TaxID=2605962 RepID=UPI004035C21F